VTANAALSNSSILLLNALAQVETPASEDCLTINVWNKGPVGMRKKAVIFWVYGGGKRED
jgi:cholinesterase